MNKNKLYAILKKHRKNIEPKMPDVYLILASINSFLKTFIDAVDKNPTKVSSKDFYNYKYIKQIKQKLVEVVVKEHHALKLSAKEIGQILVVMYLFKMTAIQKYHDNRLSNKLKLSINQVQKVYLFVSDNKHIANNNIKKLKKLY